MVVQRRDSVAPTAAKPSGVQPLVPFSAPSVKTVVPPAVSTISSAKKPATASGSLPCDGAVGAVAQPQADRLAGVGRQVEGGRHPAAWSPSMPLPSAALVIEPGIGLPAGAVVDLDERVVARVGPAVLDVPARLEASASRVPAGSVTCAGQRVVESSPVPRPPLLGARRRRAEVGGRPSSAAARTTTPCALALLYSCGPRSSVRFWPADDDLVVEPAELELVPRAEVGRRGCRCPGPRAPRRGSGAISVHQLTALSPPPAVS